MILLLHRHSFPSDTVIHAYEHTYPGKPRLVPAFQIPAPQENEKLLLQLNSTRGRERESIETEEQQRHDWTEAPPLFWTSISC